MRTPKRRKVWVNDFGGTLGSLAWPSRRLARRAGRQEAEPVKATRFVEARPGDVVLSREEYAALIATRDAPRIGEGAGGKARCHHCGHDFYSHGYGANPCNHRNHGAADMCSCMEWEEKPLRGGR